MLSLLRGRRLQGGNVISWGATSHMADDCGASCAVRVSCLSEHQKGRPHHACAGLLTSIQHLLCPSCMHGVLGDNVNAKPCAGLTAPTGAQTNTAYSIMGDKQLSRVMSTCGGTQHPADMRQHSDHNAQSFHKFRKYFPGSHTGSPSHRQPMPHHLPTHPPTHQLLC